MTDSRNVTVATYRQRLRSRLRHLRDVIDAIEERAGRADVSTALPPRRPGQRVQSSGYQDPTSMTAAERDQLLGQVEADVWEMTSQAHRAAGRLGAWAPVRQDRTCGCPRECCADGCSRPVPDGRSEHATCRSKRSRARVRGEEWAAAS